jgi:hypothetical protein
MPTEDTQSGRPRRMTEAERLEAMRKWDAEVQRRQTVEWRDASGNPIDVPTFMEAFAEAVGLRIGAVEVETAGIRDDLETLSDALAKNSATTEKISKDTAELVESARDAKGFQRTVKWFGELGKGIFWFCAALAVVGAMIYSQFVSNRPALTTAPAVGDAGSRLRATGLRRSNRSLD